MAILLAAFVCYLFAILKIIYGNRQLIGRDIAISLVYPFVPLSITMCVIMFYFMVIHFLKSLTISMAPEVGDKVTKRFNLLSTLILFVPPFSIIFCLVPLLGIPLPKYRNVFTKLYFVGEGVMALCLGSLMLNALGYLLGELSRHINSVSQPDEDIRTVYKRLCLLTYYIIALNVFLLPFTYLIFGFWDVLLKKTTYLIFCQLNSCVLVSHILIFTISGIQVCRPDKVVPFASDPNHCCEPSDIEMSNSVPSFSSDPNSIRGPF